MIEDINNTYVEWANTLDSTGKDSTAARARLSNRREIEQMFAVIDFSKSLSSLADGLKKWVFYGKEIPGEIKAPWVLDSQFRDAQVLLDNHETIRLFHAILGLTTEIGELWENFERHLTIGEPVDVPNLVEETGDLFWYLALIAKYTGHFTFTEFLLGNHAKLVARYGTEWSQDAAVNRDTKFEMEQLGDAVDWNDPAKAVPVAEMQAVAELMRDTTLEATEKFPTLQSIVTQLSACMYESKHSGGDLESNQAFIALKHYAKVETHRLSQPISGDIDEQQTRLG